jgi:hypothetical protein
MKTIKIKRCNVTIIIHLLLIMIIVGCIKKTAQKNEKLVINTYNSGFKEGYGVNNLTFNGISSASDGRIYYVITSTLINVGAQMYSFNPQNDKISHLADLTEICGEKGHNTIPQGKCHVQFSEAAKKLYFSTHQGYYEIIDGREHIPKNLPNGYKPYPGGHILSYDLVNGKFEDLGIPVPEEGVITMNMDTSRRIIYGLSWPSGILFHYEVSNRKTTVIGPVVGKGEKGQVGSSFRVICRSLAINPENGTVYFTNSEGTILSLKVGRNSIEQVERDNLAKDYFGHYRKNEIASGGYAIGSAGYNWRQTAYSTIDKMIYGVHGTSGYLFRFDPDKSRVEILERITSKPSKKSGMFDQFYYGYLGFTIGPDQHTIYYLSGAPLYDNKGKRITSKEVSKETLMYEIHENLHLITYDIRTNDYCDHGPIYYGDNQLTPHYVQSIAVGSDNTVYTLGVISTDDIKRTDLISIKINSDYTTMD